MRYAMIRYLSCLAGMLLIVAQARADVLADKVPADALVYASWAGTNNLQAPYAQSRLKEIMDASTFQATVAKALDQLERNPNVDMEAKMALEGLKTVEKMMAYPTALYVGPFANGEQPMPQAALLCQAGADADALAAELKKLMPEDAHLAVRSKDGFVLVAGGTVMDVTTKMDAAMGDAGKSLASAAAYKAALAQVQKDGALTGYVDVAALADQIDMVVAKTARPDGPKPDWIAGNYRKNLNLDGFTQVAFSAGFEGKDWGSRCFVGLKGQPRGLTSLFSSKALDESLLKNAPESSNWLMAGRLDLGAVYDQIVEAVTTIEPQASRDLAKVKDDIKAQIGIDYEADLIRPLGDQWLAYTAPAVNGAGLMGITLVSPLKDAGRFSATIDTLAPKLSQLLMSQSRGNEPVHMSVEQYTTGDVKITYGNVLLNPALSVHDGKLYAGFSPQGLVSAIDAAKSGRSILDNPKFGEFRKRLGVTTASSLSYVDLSVSGPDSYAMVSTLAGMLGIFSSEAKPTLLPPLSKLYPHLTTAGGATWSDASGWHARTLEPFPGSMLLAGGQQNLGLASMTSMPMMIAALLPSMGRARELANRTAEAANIRGCLMAAIVHSADNNDNMPEHLAQLVAESSISPKSLVTKRSASTPMVITPEQSQKMEKDWKVLQADVDAHCDLIYLGKGTKNNSYSALILIYTDPTKVDTADGMNIGFGDGHVEWVRPTGFKQAFETNNEQRTAKKLPVLKLDDRGLPVLEK